jgi:hypothetical protein
MSSEATPMLPSLPASSDKRGQSWLPPKVLRAVWSENSGFLLDRSIFSLEYFKFIRTITNLPVNAAADPEVVLPLEDITLKQTKLATTFVLTVLVLAKDRSLLPTWMRSVKRMMITCPAACMWLCMVRTIRHVPLVFAIPKTGLHFCDFSRRSAPAPTG